MNREDWFRIEERERHKFPCKKLEPGSWVNHSRTIVRAGYWLEPIDMSIQEALQIAEAHLLHYMNEWMLDPNMKTWIWRTRPLKIDITEVAGPFDREAIDVLANILGVDEDYLLRNLAYRVRGKWVAEQKMKPQPHPTFLRTFWYIEHPEISSQVYGIVPRKVGAHIPASGTYAGDIDDYDPPGFDLWTSQQLYHTGYRDFCSQKNCMIYVHPLDVE